MDCSKFTRMALRLGPALLIIVSFIALVLGTVFHAILIDEIIYKSPQEKKFDQNVKIGDKSDDLLWFMQITDLHINVMDLKRENEFKNFTQTYLDIIKPDAILVTGDITDGRVPHTLLGSGQQLHDWQAYHDIIETSNANKKTLWLDIRGNHDNFNVYHPFSPDSLYRKYSIQGKKNPRHQFNTVTKNQKTYTFIGVDEVQVVGLKAPANFLGAVDVEDLKTLANYKEKAKELNSQFTTWYAHYPTSSVSFKVNGLKSLIDGPYLCGHFHTIGNMVLRMYANQQPGYTEVELGDWKYNRYLRIAAIDHQLFSAVDFKYQQWPVALMTNPKNSEFKMPKFEPLNRILESTHIRVIAFSNASIQTVEVSIDDNAYQEMRKVDEGPLYVLEWDPKLYEKDVHTAKIMVVDSIGQKQTYNQTFILNEDLRTETSLGARILLRVPFRQLAMSIYIFMLIACIGPLMLLRFTSPRGQESCFRRTYRGTFIYSMSMMSKINRLYYPVIFVPFYVLLGPQYFGRLVDEAIGVVFAWGVVIDGHVLMTGATFNIATVFLSLIHIPITLLLIAQVGDRYFQVMMPEYNCSWSSLTLKLLLHVCLTFLQLCMALLLYSGFGILAVLTSFLYTWSIFVYCYCWYTTLTLVREDFELFEVDGENMQPLTKGYRESSGDASRSGEEEQKSELVTSPS